MEASSYNHYQPKGEKLRQLLFRAEACDVNDDRHGYTEAWLSLQCFLLAESACDPETAHHTWHLHRLCQRKLLRAVQAAAEATPRDMQAPQAAPALDFDLAERLNRHEHLAVLLRHMPRPEGAHRTAPPQAPRRPQPPAIASLGKCRTPAPDPAAVQAKDAGQRTSAVASIRKRDINGVPKAGPGSSSRWAGPPALAEQAGEAWGRGLQQAPPQAPGSASSSDEMEVVEVTDRASAPAGGYRGFQTARAALACTGQGAGHDADARQEGQGRLRGRARAQGQGGAGREPSSGGMFEGGHGIFAGSAAMRQGLRGRAPSRAEAAGAGVRGGFVPPFVRKAMDAGGGNSGEGALSAKTLEMLTGVGGELPEELAKLDPAILELVCNEILDRRAAVAWDDIAGQDAAKRLVQELVVWPMLNPHLFKGARAPPKGLLLFGPPGTGKTLLGKAIAANIRATFFAISASSLTSKWIGEGEKMVRALFAVAAALQPSVIFIDEIDSVLSARKAEGEHEASRRLKTEMLIQMEGCSPDAADRRVLIVGATNRPEELDEAARRRLPKQLYIPLPCAAARAAMVQRQLGPSSAIAADLPPEHLAKLVARTAGYSGSDMRALIQEACQGPVRDAIARHGAALDQLSESDLRPVVLRDFQMAAKAQRASVEPLEIARYEAYNAKHGARCIDDGEGVMEEDEW